MPVTTLDAMTHTASGAPAGWTPGAGANRIAFIAFLGYHFSDAVPPTSATFGGQTMELVGAADNALVAVSIFALREAGIAAMSGNTVTPSGQAYSAANCVYWSVQGAHQSASFVKTEQVTSSDVAASLARAASSMTFAVSVLNAADTLTWTNPTDDAEAFIGSAFGMTYGGETDSSRTANWTSDNPGVQFAGIAFNVAPAASGSSGSGAATEGAGDAAAGVAQTVNRGLRSPTIYEPNNDSVIADATSVRAIVRDAVGGTELLDISTATIVSGICTIDNDAVGALGATVDLELRWTSGGNTRSVSGQLTVINLDL